MRLTSLLVVVAAAVAKTMKFELEFANSSMMMIEVAVLLPSFSQLRTKING